MLESSIQFFGLPGSGKTTKFKKLLSLSSEKYRTVPSFSRLKRFFLAILFVFRFPRISFIFLSFLSQNDKRIRKYIAHLVSISFAGHMFILLNRKREVFLVDEGILQRLLSVIPRELKKDEAISILKIFRKLNTAIILIDGGNFSRFTIEPDRMNSARNRLGSEYFNTWSQNLRKNFNLISSLLDNNFIVYRGQDAEVLNSKII